MTRAIYSSTEPEPTLAIVVHQLRDGRFKAVVRVGNEIRSAFGPNEQTAISNARTFVGEMKRLAKQRAHARIKFGD